MVAIGDVQGTANQADDASLRVAKRALGGKVSARHAFDRYFFLVSLHHAGCDRLAIASDDALSRLWRQQSDVVFSEDFRSAPAEQCRAG